MFCQNISGWLYGSHNTIDVNLFLLLIKQISHTTIDDFDEDRINLDGFVDHVSATEASSVYELKTDNYL